MPARCASPPAPARGRGPGRPRRRRSGGRTRTTGTRPRRRRRPGPPRPGAGRGDRGRVRAARPGQLGPLGDLSRRQAGLHVLGEEVVHQAKGPPVLPTARLDGEEHHDGPDRKGRTALAVSHLDRPGVGKGVVDVRTRIEGHRPGDVHLTAVDLVLDVLAHEHGARDRTGDRFQVRRPERTPLGVGAVAAARPQWPRGGAHPGHGGRRRRQSPLEPVDRDPVEAPTVRQHQGGTGGRVRGRHHPVVPSIRRRTERTRRRTRVPSCASRCRFRARISSVSATT